MLYFNAISDQKFTVLDIAWKPANGGLRMWYILNVCGADSSIKSNLIFKDALRLFSLIIH